MSTSSNMYGQGRHFDMKDGLTAATPLRWLERGLMDVVSAPVASLTLGLGFTLLCVAAYAGATAAPGLTVAILVLMLLVSPFFAATAYHVARQLELGISPSLRASLYEVRKRGVAVGLFAMFCGLLVAAWMRLSSITFALYFGAFDLSAAEIAPVWSEGGSSLFLVVFLVLASVVLGLALFITGAISLPIIADRNMNIVDAIRGNLQTLRKNATTTFVWLVLVLSTLAVALLSSLVLLPLVFPLLAYATWHSYRQLSES